MNPTTQQHSVAVQQQPMVTVQPDPSRSISNGTNSRRNWKGLQITGYAQVVLGIISVFFGILAIVFETYFYFLGYAVWMGICFYIVAGILGIASAGKQKKGLVAGYLILSIIAAVCACAEVVLAGLAISNDFFYCPDWRHQGHNYDLIDRVGCSSPRESRMAISALILVVGVAELVVAIIGACLTCSGLCCNPRPSYPMVYYQSAPQVMVTGQPTVQYAYVPQQQFIQQPQHGNVMYPAQPMIVAPTQPLPQPLPQHQGTVPPQAQAPSCETSVPTSNLPEDHHKKPLIT